MEIRSTRTVIAAIISAAVVLLLVFVRSIAIEAVYPFERLGQIVSRQVVSRIRGAFRGARLAEENRLLRREVDALSLLRNDFDRLEAENARLRQTLGYLSKAPDHWIAAGVLSRGGGAAAVGQIVRIDKGSKAGIVRGAVVVTPDGLVGRIARTTPHTSEVALITDASVKVSCSVESPNGTQLSGILCGGDEEQLNLRRFTGSGDHPPRSRVTTSGRGGVFPGGIEVGSLLRLRKDAEGHLLEGEVLPSVDFNSLEDVFVRCEK